MKDIAEFVGISHQYVSKKKKEDHFPVEWAFKIARKYRLLTEWIMTGEGPKRLEDGNYTFPILHELDQWLIELVVNEPDRRTWFSYAVQDAFPMFKQWKKRKEDQCRDDNSAEGAKVA